jgi:hypothetical protein
MRSVAPVHAGQSGVNLECENSGAGLVGVIVWLIDDRTARGVNMKEVKILRFWTTPRYDDRSDMHRKRLTTPAAVSALTKLVNNNWQITAAGGDLDSGFVVLVHET